MHDIVNNLILINKELSAINSDTKIIAVSKLFQLIIFSQLLIMDIYILAKIKFKRLWKNGQKQKKNKSIKLHLIGKLQTNKVKFCLPLFDFIHSLIILS